MADLRDYEVFSRVGLQADRTTTATGSGGGAWVDIAINKDGMQLNSNKVTTTIDTEHRFRGPAYTFFTQRNSESGTISTPLYPNMMGTLMNGVFALDGNGDLNYHTWEFYWDASLTGGDDAIRYKGVIFDGVSFTIDRNTEGSVITADFTAYVNSKEVVSATVPTFTRSALDPYVAADAVFDFVGDSTTFLGGDNPDVLSVSVTYQNNTELKAFLSNSTAILNKTWTRQYVGEVSAQITVELLVSNDDYLKYDEGASTTVGAIRMAVRHPVTGATDTTTADIAAADSSATETYTTAGSATFSAGDIIYAYDADNNRFCTLPVVSHSGTTLTIDRATYSSYVDVEGSGATAVTLEDRCWGLVVPSMNLLSSTPPTSNGNVRTVTLNYEATITAGQTAVVVPMFANM